MTTPDWRQVRMVVFDLDGTLYDQGPLRWTMAVELVRDALHSRSLRTIRVLRRFRKIREHLGERAAGHAAGNFLDEQYRLTAQACGCEESEVRSLTREWLEERPLRRIARYKAPGIDKLFAAIRASGRVVAVWSDYPVTAKLAALGLAPDHAVWAGDDAVGRLKPDPSGLTVLLVRTGIRARETLVIGDRWDRDAAAAQALGAHALLRSARRRRDFSCFRRYDDPVFAGLCGVPVHA